jgi:hypothetical protein
MKSTSQIQYESFLEDLKVLTDQEIIQAFNKEVGNTGWVSARGSYLAAIRKEFERRSFDYSLIGNERSLSLVSSVKLKDGKLHI